MVRKFLKDILLQFQSKNLGATAIEYALIASLLSVALIAGYRLIGKRYTTLYNGITDQLNEVDKATAESGAMDGAIES